MASSKLACLLRGVLRPSKQKEIKAWKEKMREHQRVEEPALPSGPRVNLGIQGNTEYYLPLSEAVGGGHYFLTGTTGSGKSFLALHLILSLLHYKMPLLLLDMKGEMSSLLVEKFLPLYLSKLPPAEREDFLGRFIYFDPFSEDHLLPFNILKRISGVDVSLQAHEISSLIEETVGQDLGANQVMVLGHALKLAIEGERSFLDVRRILTDPFFRDGLLKKSNSAEEKEYFLLRYEHESQASINSILNRLALFSSLPSIRKMLGASEAISFESLLSGTLAVINLGNAPLGAVNLQRFMATLLLTRLARTICSRPVDGNTPPSLVIVDEFQEALTGSLAQEFERLLCLARSKRVFFALITQLLQNVDRVSPTLGRVILTNSLYHILFKMSLEDAQRFAPLIRGTSIEKTVAPKWGEVRRSMTQEERAKLLLRELSTLPTQSFYFWHRGRGSHASRLIAPTLELPPLSPEAKSIKARLLAPRSFTLLPDEKVERRCEKVDSFPKTPKEGKPRQGKLRGLLDLG